MWFSVVGCTAINQHRITKHMCLGTLGVYKCIAGTNAFQGCGRRNFVLCDLGVCVCAFKRRLCSEGCVCTRNNAMLQVPPNSTTNHTCSLHNAPLSSVNLFFVWELRCWASPNFCERLVHPTPRHPTQHAYDIPSASFLYVVGQGETASALWWSSSTWSSNVERVHQHPKTSACTVVG